MRTLEEESRRRLRLVRLITFACLVGLGHFILAKFSTRGRIISPQWLRQGRASVQAPRLGGRRSGARSDVVNARRTKSPCAPARQACAGCRTFVLSRKAG